MTYYTKLQRYRVRTQARVSRLRAAGRPIGSFSSARPKPARRLPRWQRQEVRRDWRSAVLAARGACELLSRQCHALCGSRRQGSCGCVPVSAEALSVKPALLIAGGADEAQ